jgi:hypothetical protein
MGFEIPIQWLSILLYGSLGLLLALGLPMAFCTGSLATIFLFVFGNSAVLNMMPSRIFPFMTDYQLSAVPLFIFMAAVLEKAGIIEELFDVIYKWLGALKGGLASATVVACTLLAAMVGVVGATAARALTGHAMAVGANRGRITDLPDGTKLMITVHPSYLLHVHTEDQEAEYERFVADLALVAEYLATFRVAASPSRPPQPTRADEPPRWNRNP